jgi:hypothetical protein
VRTQNVVAASAVRRNTLAMGLREGGTDSVLSDIGEIQDNDAMNITKNIGMLLLAIYLIAVGIVTLTGLGIGIITGVLALASGIFILLGR